jgi:CheY-like chemotaxis protein
MNGLEATRRIKASPRGKETIVIALTASAMNEDRQTVIQSGADGFIAKPCTEEELLEKIRSLLGIAYDYEEAAGQDSHPAAALPAPSPEKVGQLPRDLIQELRDATANGNKKRLDELILRVPESGDNDVAHSLKLLADNYEYDALTRLLEEACHR